jgi:TolB-like protein
VPSGHFRKEQGSKGNEEQREVESMKKMIFVIVLLTVTFTALFAQEKPQLAVVSFSTNLNTEKVRSDTIMVRNLVESAITGTNKYSVITRNKIDELLKEQKISVSSISSNENREKLQLRKISYIVTGSVNAVDNHYLITINVLDVSSGEFLNSKKALIGNSANELFAGLDKLSDELIKGMTAEGGRVTQVTSNKTYKVGDFGPAGGYIFFDKGVFSNGWRYLEAAPFETEFKAQTGIDEFDWRTNIQDRQDIPRTNIGIGFGKRNTEIIVEQLKALGESGKAAQVCANLNFDGYKDWFLPSKEELNLMYMNLKQKGLGRFTNDWYLSSSYDPLIGAWIQRFSDGAVSDETDYDTEYSVRTVRAF